MHSWAKDEDERLDEHNMSKLHARLSRDLPLKSVSERCWTALQRESHGCILGRPSEIQMAWQAKEVERPQKRKECIDKRRVLGQKTGGTEKIVKKPEIQNELRERRWQSTKRNKLLEKVDESSAAPETESQSRKFEEECFAYLSARIVTGQPLEREGKEKVSLEGQTLTVRIWLLCRPAYVL